MGGYRGQTPEEVDDDISEYGAGAVAAGLHRMGREPTQAELDKANKKHEHQWEEADAEPPYDVCISCGKVRR